MESQRIAAPAAALVLILFWNTAAQAQPADNPIRLANIQERLSQVSTLLDNLPESERRALSSGAQNILQLAHGWSQVQRGLQTASLANLQATYLTALSSPILTAQAGLARVSNPNTDFLFSIMAGFTQSETSTAWCGNNVAVAFNDSGSLFQSLLFGPGGQSFSGASISTDRGVSFRDVGPINPGSNPNNFLGGDPVINCSVAPSNRTAITFYLSQIFMTVINQAPIASVALSKSTDGGAVWADPVAAAQKDAFTHFLDKPWSTVDPTNSASIFITYTDVDSSGVICGGTAQGPIQRTAIELVRSTDGGTTWSAPQVIVEACNSAPNFPFVQGSQVALDSRGNVYVAWESLSDPTGTTRQLLIRKSVDRGVGFGATVKIADVIYSGDSFGLQGGFRNNDFPMLAIDRSDPPADPAVASTAGNLYVTWNDGRNFRVNDLEAGLYGYADILLSRSTNGAATWSVPIRVNNDPIFHVFTGSVRGTDHFQPGIAVDRTGTLGLCWYDRRLDPANFLINRVCGNSVDGGNTWTNTVEFGNWPPWHAVDVFVNPFYLGDYDMVTSDVTKANSGFLGAFGYVNAAGILVPNQDVLMVRFP